MEEIQVSKQVFFIGAWRTQTVTDQLLRQISTQMTSKRGYSTTLNLKAEGLELFILNAEGKVTRTDKIALQNVVDFIDNKYNSRCILAIVKDKQHYTIFVFVCSSEKDAADMVQGFEKVKKRLSGEGYNLNLKPKGMNWTLSTKQEPMVHRSSEHGQVRVVTAGGAPYGNSNVRVVTTGDAQNANGSVRVVTSEGTHTEDIRFLDGDIHGREIRVESASNDRDTESHTSELQGELQHLAGEVRDIKLMLQKSRGRQHFEKHYGYRIAQGSPGQVRTEVIADSTGHHRQQYDVRDGSDQAVYVRQEVNPPKVVVLRASNNNINQRPMKTGGHVVSNSSLSRAGYTKRVYESENPALEQGVYRQQQAFKHVDPSTHGRILVPKQRPRSGHFIFSDTVPKNIENVYKSRSLRRTVVPVASGQQYQTAEYVESHQLQAQPRTPLIGTGTPPRHLSTTVVTKQTKQNAQHVRYDPDVRGFNESNDRNEAEVSIEGRENVSKVVNVSSTFDSSEGNDDYREREVDVRHVERDENVTYIGSNSDDRYDQEFSQHSDNVTYIGSNSDDRHDQEFSQHSDNVTYIGSNSDGRHGQEFSEHSDNVIVIRAETDSNVQHAPRGSYENIGSNSDGRHGQEFSEHSDNVIVIRAETDSNVQHAPRGSYENVNVIRISDNDQYSHQYDEPQTTGGGVYHVRAGGVDKVSNGYHGYDEDNVIIVDTTQNVHSDGSVVEIRRNSNDGLWGNYTQKPEGQEFEDTVVKERAYRYHDGDDDDNVGKKPDTDDENEAREVKRVHYNEDIEQTISDRNSNSDHESEKHDDDGNDENNEDKNNNDGDKNGDEEVVDDDDDEAYVINEEELRKFQQAPNVIIVDREEDRVIKTGDTVKHVVNGEVSDIVYESENTVLF